MLVDHVCLSLWQPQCNIAHSLAAVADWQCIIRSSYNPPAARSSYEHTYPLLKF